MGSVTWGTGTDIFAVDYLDTQVPETGNNAYHSADFSSHMLSALELKRLSSHYESGISTSTNDLTPQNAPLSLKQEGATPGYYRTFHYRSHPADGYFFSQNILMYDRHIITNVSDIQRLVWKPTINQYTRTNVTMVDGSTQTFSYYQISQFEASKMSILKKGSTSEYTATNINIVPAIISPDTANTLQCFNYWDRNVEECVYPDFLYRRYNQTYGTGSDNTARYSPTFNNGEDIIVPNAGSLTSLWAFDDTNNYVMRLYYKAADTASYLWTSTCEVKYWVKTDDELCHVLARSGVKFEFNGVIYKPLAENGVIIGYTDDMDRESEWDNWHDYNDHEVPITPPAPPTPTGDKDDMDLTEIGFTSSIGGAAFYWVFNGPPTGVFDDFNEHAPEGSMLSQNIVSCYLSALNYAWHTANQKIVIYTNGSQMPAYESTNAYPLIYNDHNPHFVVGKFDVPRQTNTFYDFSPYSTYELFIPFCGWMGLPDTVAGRTIRVYMDCDVATCTCKAIVMLESEGGETIIGEITGNFGAPCPIQVVEGGLYKQAAISSGLQIASGVASGIYGASAGAGALAISGFSNALQGIQNLHAAGNTNYGQTIGRAGDCSNLGGGHYCKIRITHPVVDEVVNNSMFGHTVGYLCNTVGTLSSFSGFTVCINPHITGINCTDEEKEEIKGLLENGVIL